MANETTRQTKDGAWTRPDGPISRKVFRVAVGIKEIVQRVVEHPAAVEELTHHANELIAESERIAAMEARPMLIFCAGRGQTIH